MSVNMKNWQELKKPNSLDVKSGGDAKRIATMHVGAAADGTWSTHASSRSISRP